MYKIGIQYKYYPEKRNIIDKVDNAMYIEISTNVSLISRILKKIKREFKIKRLKKNYKRKRFIHLDLTIIKKLIFFTYLIQFRMVKIIGE